MDRDMTLVHPTIRLNIVMEARKLVISYLEHTPD